MIESVCAEVDRDMLMRHMEELARHTKVAGSPEELESLRYCERVMRDYGFETEIILHDAFISLPEAGARVTLGDLTAEAITHSFSRSAPEGGLRAEVVDVGKGGPDNYEGRDVRGKIVLMDGIANPVVTQRASRAGAVGQIHVSPSEQRHEMCISPVWGSPSDRKLAELPTTVVCTVRESDGVALRARLAEGAEAVLHAQVDTRWRPTPILVAEMASERGGAGEPFVFYTGHHDTWYFGVMDNGGANATMMEVARIAARYRSAWRRGLRVVFWSGHSQGRYSSSAWYADQHWEELAARALVHVNVDSTGGLGNRVVSTTTAAAELRGVAAEALRAQAGQGFENRRMGRAGDQSFWGIGVPAIFANMSTQPAEPEAQPGPPSMFRGGKAGGFGTGWWWHTPDDLLDKIDPDILVRDTRIYMHAVWRLLADPVLPFDYADHGRYLLAELDALQQAADGCFDLSGLRRRAERLLELAEALPEAGEGDAERINSALRRVARAVVPVDYTDCDAFDHDPALPMGPYPGLQPVRELAKLPAGSDAARFLEVRLVRARTRVAVALATACAALEELVEAPEQVAAE